jgi:flagellar protein FliJ
LTATGLPARRPAIVKTEPPSPVTAWRGGASTAPDESAANPSATASRSASGSRTDSTSDLDKKSTGSRLLQVWTPFADGGSVETPSFTFRLERVRTIRERAEERAREALSTELRNRAEGEVLLRNATDAVDAARDATRSTVIGGRISATDFISAQAFIERTERLRVEASLELARREAEVNVRRQVLAAAARDRQAIEKLKERQKAEHDAEWARRSQNTLDELALAVHRRGGAVAA